VLFLVVLFWQTSTQTIVIISGIFRWFLRAVFFFCLLGFAWGAKALGFFDPFGLRPILNLLHGRNQGVMRLTVAGPYHLVRHPLYLFTIVIIWSCLDLTADRLLFNLLWTAWIVTASYFEERDLVAEFGNTYREYQKRVPMLILFLEWRKGNGQSGRKEANV
jgi:protein-S-isoprenylcysteine O-methyltransferase Ste14